MKRAGIVVAFLLLVATTATSVLLFQQKTTKINDLAHAEDRLKEVKKAFEERGRLLEGVQQVADTAKKQASSTGLSLEKAMAELEVEQVNLQTAKLALNKLVANRDGLENSLKTTQKQLDDSRKTAENSKIGTKKELEDLRKKLADIKSLDKQLKQANNRIEELKKNFGSTTAELDSQKQLLEDKRAAIKEYEDLKVSPSQIRRLIEENTELKRVFREVADLPVKAPSPKLPESVRPTIEALPLSLKLPLPEKRLTKPLKSKDIPKPGQK